jgi:hypothetical protein
MYFSNPSEMSLVNNGKKISQQLILTVVQYLCFKLLMGLGLLVVLGHNIKNIWSVLPTNRQKYSWLSSTKSPTYTPRANKP